MAEAFADELMQLDNEGPLQEIFENGADSRVQWGRLIACLPQLDSIDLIQPSLKLGRCDNCDIVIHKSKFLPGQLFYVSKEHFLISRDSEDEHLTYIIDLSKNGTYVNGILVGRHKKMILQNNDLIAIGEKLQVYIFKSMSYLVPEDYLPPLLRKKYEVSTLLGVGACGEVRLAYNKYSCEKYAIKKIVKGRDTLSQRDSINHPNRIRVEMDILRTLNHPFAIRIIEVVDTEQETFLVLDYVDGGELTKLIVSPDPISESSIKFLFYQMVLAVQYLHSRGVTHRDLKPGNILLTTKDSLPVIKLVDFGLSTVSDGYDLMKTTCGTWHYMAPEILNPKITYYTKQVDVWSLGVILFYMLSKELPFQAADKSILGRLIISGTYDMRSPAWYEVSSDAKDLIRKMLLVNPLKRITISGIVNHPWIVEDNLMLFRVENLQKSFDYTTQSGRPVITKEEKTVLKGIKRIRLACGSGEPSM